MNDKQKKKEILKKLDEEKEKLLLELCNLDPTDPKYKEVSDNYERLCRHYDDIKYGVLKKVNWGDLLSLLAKLGAATTFLVILLIIESSQWFPRTRHALNAMMKLFLGRL